MNLAEQNIPKSDAKNSISEVISTANQIILGKDEVIRLALVCMIARGHLLIEDTPGVGKTTLAHVLAKTLGLSYQRIQFTSDMLPADILGVSVFDRQSGKFEFHPGPIFSQFILADEVNRATPRAQSALLEAMEENQITLEGETRQLPEPFFVIATQNPSNQIGTFPLPESQLDRFMMRLHLGYPDNNAERELLKGRDRREMLSEIQAVISPDELIALQRQAPDVIVSDAILDYLQDLLEFSRVTPDFNGGLSPRAGLAVLRCSQAWSLLLGRSHVLPEDIQAVLPSVVAHRLHPANEKYIHSPDMVSELLIKQVPIP
ncbi:MAG: MoxR family ATPase [Gammaproteobacteria bacterium]|nr:MoxR family ATPase [Gammaproteobacteria bacterium]